MNHLAAVIPVLTSRWLTPPATGQIMQFDVVPAVAPDPTTPPQFLQLPAIAPLPPATVTRPLALLEEMSAFFADAPAETLLGTVAGDPNVAPGVWAKRLWMEPVTENPTVGATEVWEFYNATGDGHPMHVHEVVFEVLNRQDIFVNEATQEVQVVPGSVPIPPEPWETGFKDTVIAYPGQVTTHTRSVQHAGSVRLALPHRRARGQRDDAAVPHRTGAAWPAAADGTRCRCRRRNRPRRGRLPALRRIAINPPRGRSVAKSFRQSQQFHSLAPQKRGQTAVLEPSTAPRTERR